MFSFNRIFARSTESTNDIRFRKERRIKSFGKGNNWWNFIKMKWMRFWFFFVFRYLLQRGNNFFKIDVKTKRCTSKPKSYYDCSIAKTSLHQKCDKYVFVRIEWHKERPDEWKNAWILGELSKKDYFKKSVQELAIVI